MTNREMLEQWSDEHLYVDIGIGFEVDGQGNVIPSTAFDSAISGTDFIGGCGVDADGESHQYRLHHGTPVRGLPGL